MEENKHDIVEEESLEVSRYWAEEVEEAKRKYEFFWSDIEAEKSLVPSPSRLGHLSKKSTKVLVSTPPAHHLL